ncbi:juvenile hormone esterase isoform X1 [Anopheles funestus]|uniref:juvenile hormone esterase isoform X1 n=2 Tax=Anopheles funestus TaxID=62324 RepID=UPI0020C71741|nr:juvenile hormone esterase isoform X1 [Anopheles funestus]
MLRCAQQLGSKFMCSARVPLATSVRWMRNVDRVNVKVHQGTVSGVKEKLPNGNTFCAFRGIPYAKPPVGELRFRAPQPLERFPYPVLDCSVERDVCFSRNMFTQELEGSENCLHLNVYTPAMDKRDKPLPVMVFIHGGAFLFGSGNGDCYSPEYLLQEDVIVVTLNYRLGSLGFLHLPSQGIEGNAGLKDQLLVLRWVQQNIAHFRGDPNNVTLFGESAGAASVHLHMLSPVSQKYFHKAICQSGISTMEWVMQHDSVNRTRSLARHINADAKTDEEVYQTLLQADKAELMGLMIHTLSADEKRRGLPMPFKPVVEEGQHDANTVVPVHPFVAMQQQDRASSIPIIFGNNDREGTIMMMDAIKKLDLYDNDMARMIPRTVNVAPGSAACEELAKEVKQFYCGAQGVTKETVNQLADLMTDYHFGILANTCAELHARYQPNSPMFYYQFSYDGELNMYKKLLQLTIPGACHADELSYLFLMRLANYDVKPDTEAGRVRQLMCRLWTNFAKCGHPTPADDRSVPCRWEPVDKVAPSTANTPFQLKCLDIAAEPKMMMNPAKERIDFWRSVYKRWNEDFLKVKL